VEAHKPWLAPFWTSARAQSDEAQIAVLARELETIARKVLETLYPSQQMNSWIADRARNDSGGLSSRT
jgi:hypothetical protein